VKLALAGVEVIQAEGTFERRSVNRRPRLGFTLAERWLRSRAYLLTPTVRATVPAIDGLTAVDFVTLDSLWHSWQTLPQQIVILGVDPRGLALAQALNRLGGQVTVITSGELMPQHDPELAFLLQAQLEAEGVTVLTQTPIAQVRQTEQRIWIQTNEQTIETEALLLATKPQLELAELDLETAGVAWNPDQIRVNRKLQTTNSRIYACGNFSTQSVAIDRYEADVAVSNALFLPWKQVDYRSVPIAVFTDPPLVSVGLSEPQAQPLYGEEVLVVQQSYKTLLKAQVSGDTTGLLKLLCHRNGKIIGAHCFGADADEWISLVTLAMQQRLNLKALAQLPTLSHTMSDLLRQAADQLLQQQRSQRQRDLLETWFNFRRAR
jgi:pyruvate/2-oxoglutarate dehydrogenase complex dihydrolipoamide dehydrogenase (E3) component